MEGATAGCCCQSAGAAVRFGAGMLVPLHGAAAGCSCQSAVCALELACYCRCRVLFQGAAVSAVRALWSWVAGAGAG